jgi:acyl-CoA dehydrogenase
MSAGRQPPRRRDGQAPRHRSAQQVIDGGADARRRSASPSGVKVEELYREIRALRIYEGASEVQRQIIARDLLKEHRA